MNLLTPGLLFVPIIFSIHVLSAKSMEGWAEAMDQGMRGEEITATAPTAEEWIDATMPLVPLVEEALQLGNTSEVPLE